MKGTTRWDEFDAEVRWLKVEDWYVRVGGGAWSAVRVSGDLAQRLSGKGDEAQARAAIKAADVKAVN